MHSNWWVFVVSDWNYLIKPNFQGKVTWSTRIADFRVGAPVICLSLERRVDTCCASVQLSEPLVRLKAIRGLYPALMHDSGNVGLIFVLAF